MPKPLSQLSKAFFGRKAAAVMLAHINAPFPHLILPISGALVPLSTFAALGLHSYILPRSVSFWNGTFDVTTDKGGGPGSFASGRLSGFHSIRPSRGNVDSSDGSGGSTPAGGRSLILPRALKLASQVSQSSSWRVGAPWDIQKIFPLRNRKARRVQVMWEGDRFWLPHRGSNDGFHLSRVCHKVWKPYQILIWWRRLAPSPRIWHKWG